MSNRRFDLVMEKQRPWIVAAALIGSVSALTNILVIYTIPGATSVDIIAQVAVTIAIIGLTVLVLLDTETLIRLPAKVIAVTIMVGLLARWLFSLFGHGPDAIPDETIAPVMSWMPFAFVMAFVFLERRLALRVSLVAMSGGAIIVLVYAAMYAQHLSTSPRMAEMIMQALLAHPIYVIFLTVISRIHVDYGLLETHGSDSDVENALLRRSDQLTLLPDRRAFREDLGRIMNEGRDHGTEVVVGLLQIDGLDMPEGDIDAMGVDACIVIVADRLRHDLGDEAQAGRLSDNRFGIIWQGCTLSELIGVAERMTATLNEQLRAACSPCPLCNMGLAVYRPGESVPGLLARCNEELLAARQRANHIGYDTLEI